MKKLITLIIIACTINVYSQTFQKGTYTQNISFGISHFIEIGEKTQRNVSTFYYDSPWQKSNLMKGSFLYSYEYGVSDAIGISMFTGFAMNRPKSSQTYDDGFNTQTQNFRFNQYVIPIGGTVNYHFYDDIKSKKSISNNLDIYVGIDIGGAFGFYMVEKDKRNFVDPSFGTMGYIILGPHIGIRKYFKSGNGGIYAELGYGKSILNIGFTFKSKHSI